MRESYNNRTVASADPTCTPSLEAPCFAFIPVITRLAGEPIAAIAVVVAEMDKRNAAYRRVRTRFGKDAQLETAERKARLREANADPLRQSPPDAVLRTTIAEAVKAFLQDEEARQLAKTTTSAAPGSRFTES